MSKDGIISLAGLDLKVVPQNEYSSLGLIGFIIPIIPWPTFYAYIDRPHFEIQIILDPQGEDFTLDLGRIALEFPDRPAISPVGFKRGPGALTDETEGVLVFLGEPPSENVSCEVNFKADSVPVPITPITVSDRTCFVLVFPLPPPSPNQQFTLSIGGILKMGQPFPLPPIHFKKGSTLVFGWGIDL